MCPIWCRLREIGSHFSFFSCTHICTHASSSESGASVATMLTLLIAPFSLKLIRPPPNQHEVAIPGRFRVADFLRRKPALRPIRESYGHPLTICTSCCR
jgi:hypothetical protein